MAQIVILGAGVAGHAAARYLSKWIKSPDQIIVISPNSKWNWIPSNIWVGVGQMTERQVTFPLAPIYQKMHVKFYQARALTLHPDGGAQTKRPYVTLEYTDPARAGQTALIEYDYLINATGPKLDFAATPGLAPEDGYTLSVCTAVHAVQASQELQRQIAAMRQGAKRTFVIGTGHGMCTCQGAAFEYIYNVDYTLREAGVRAQARLIWISNEYELGDFGIGGVHCIRGGYVTSSKIFVESLMAEREVEWITRAHVSKVEANKIYYELLDGTHHELNFDFAMLIPPFSGVGIKAYDQTGGEITDQIFAPNGFMKVDADYTPKAFEAWQAADWPRTYQNPRYPNLFAAGIAFAPPHAISMIMKSPNGTQISPTPARTGMPSAAMGKAVAHNVYDLLKGKSTLTHTASMAEMGAACIASTGSHILRGTAVTMTVFPTVPDYKTYPEYGRDLRRTFTEIGLAGHWMKYILHYMFLHQAQLRPGWQLFPD